MEEYLAILKKYWGYDSFRQLQPEIIQSIGNGQDTLGLMPTGGGKSLTFQVPALSKEGVCLVVTPLIALMKDQVANLRKRGISAACIYSGLSFDDMNVAFDNCIVGACKFLYLAPERLSTDLFLEKICNMRVSMLVVDEAHCISQWGYDFRPSYLKIAEIRKYLSNVPVLALTATATPIVVKDIMDKLKFAKPNVFQKSFARENITYIVRSCEDKEQQMLFILNKIPGSSIVYVRNRRKTREYAEMLCGNGISAAYFHAGLDIKDKDKIQQNWAENKIRVIVCTNAFGMGIDKPDVRSVIHLNAPDSIEAYFQEAGRAGRDGKRAFAVFLWSKTDATKLRRNINDSFPPKKEIFKNYESICNYKSIGMGSGLGFTTEFDIGDFCQKFHRSITEVHYSLKLLSTANILNYQEDLELSSRLMFTIDRDKLFFYEEQYPELDIVIKTILRSYTGLFTEYATIDEDLIAKHCNIDRQTLYNRLLFMTRLKIVSYNPRKKCTMLTWSRERLCDNDFRLPANVYDDRLKEARERSEAVIHYCSTDKVCRSQQLLAYFGEMDSKPCGHCDVCLNKQKKTGLEIGQFSEIEQTIKSKLIDGPHTIEEICVGSENENKKTMEVLRWMCDFGHVVFAPNGTYRLN